MQIAVCDDVNKELRRIRAALDQYVKTHPEYYFDIDEYRSADDVLCGLEKGKLYDIALLDIFMPGVLGTDLAKEMLAKNPNMGVIFLTSSDEFAVTAFEMNAVHYLIKPFSQEQFNEALDRAVKKMEKQNFLSLACVDGMYRVSIRELVSVESQKHYLMIRLASGETLRLREKLSQMYEDLQDYPEFIRVGVSYIVNLNFVRRISSSSLEIMDGVEIAVPRRCSEDVKRTYMTYYRKETLK